DVTRLELLLSVSQDNPISTSQRTCKVAVQQPISRLRDLDAIDTQPVASLGIPRAIGAVFERQVRRLDAASRAALDLAAVLGRRLSDMRLSEAVHMNNDQTIETLARLTWESLINEV